MATYEQLYSMAFGNLDAAVTDWQRTTEDLDTLAEEARDGLRAKTAEADWAGLNADVSRQFVYTTVTQFAYAHGQARAIHAILRDLRDEQLTCQRQLHELEAGAAAEGVYIQGNGTVIPRQDGPYSTEHLEGAGGRQTLLGADGPTAAAVEAMTARIAEVLGRSEDADTTAARALREIVGEDRDTFQPAGPVGMENAEQRQGEADAREALRLIESGDYETPEGAARLNDLLETHRDNEHFAVDLATGLGAEGTLSFWADARITDHTDGTPPSDAYTRTIREMRENLGITLGTATRADDPRMAEWEERVVALGLHDMAPADQAHPLYGFQAMSDLMHHGDYDDGFLTTYGDALLETDRNLADGTNFWVPDARTHFVGDDFRSDPMTGFLTGLSASPDAATAFFTAEEENDHATYLIRERHYPDTAGEVTDNRERIALGALGDALYAGATGMDPNDPTAERGDHTPEQEAVLHHVLEVESGAKNDLPPELREPTARLLGDYRTEVFETARNPAGSGLPLDAEHLAVVTAQISRTPEAYETLQGAMAVEFMERIHADTSGDPSRVLDDIGWAAGFLDQGRFAALEIDKANSSWAGQQAYDIGGYLIGDIPWIGSSLQSGLDQLLGAWTQHQEQTIGNGLQDSRSDYYGTSNQYLNGLADQWMRLNPDPLGAEDDVWQTETQQVVRDGARRSDDEARRLLIAAGLITED
ncbi:DUF6571 family protein [Streptomyces sp. NPDC049881]|uniref:DUF6571 family protein n=2 Tax=unclassified Streptomyces TaxID=2593676 RepID=UPI003434D4C3